jgi:hypothetical protein
LQINCDVARIRPIGGRNLRPAQDRIGGTYVAPTAEPINGVVLMQDGRISAIGSKASLSVPPAFQSLDGSPKTITAGFWNSHVHFLSERGPMRRPFPPPSSRANFRTCICVTALRTSSTRDPRRDYAAHSRAYRVGGCARAGGLAVRRTRGVPAQSTSGRFALMDRGEGIVVGHTGITRSRTYGPCVRPTGFVPAGGRSTRAA